MDLDTALLRAFVAVADETHFGRAATQLHISQQGLSKRVARLEELLGVKLLVRDRRHVELTPAGRELLHHARDVLEAVAAVATVAGTGEPLRVDVMDEHSAAMGLLRAAVDADSDLAVTVAARGAERTAGESLSTGHADIAFGRAHEIPWPREFRRRCVLLEPIALLVGAEHPVAGQEHVSVDQLRHIPLRFPLAGAPQDWVDFLAEFARDFDFEVDTTGCSLGFEHFTDHPAEHPEAASFYGMGMRAPDGDRLRLVRIVDPMPVFPWAAMWRRRLPEAAVNRVVGSAAARVPSGVWMPAVDRAWIATASQTTRSR